MADFGRTSRGLLLLASQARGQRSKRLPFMVQARDNEIRSDLYRNIQRTVPDSKSSIDGTSASVLLISGCTDDQSSYDGPRNGAFTGAVLAAWNAGSFTGNYRDFYADVEKRLSHQSPQWFPVGSSDETFYAERPLTI